MPKAVAAQFQRIETPPRMSIACVVDGEAVDALDGDTVLTAVLTHRRKLRAFEFSDTERSGFCLMGACQDCWVHLATGEPVRACTTPIEPGMSIATRRPGATP